MIDFRSTDVREVLSAQRAMCSRFGAEFEHSLPDLKVGISRDLLESPRSVPQHGLRHRPTPSTTGWYLWSGEKTDDPDFFVPLRLAHIWTSHAHLLPYLGLARGWRFLLAPGYEDVWFDPEIAQLDG